MATIDSTPNPQVIAIIMALIRAGLILFGAVGLVTTHYTDAQIAGVSGALAAIIGIGWQVYEQFRQARLRHAAAVASARGARAVQHKDYSGGGPL